MYCLNFVVINDGCRVNQWLSHYQHNLFRSLFRLPQIRLVSRSNHTGALYCLNLMFLGMIFLKHRLQPFLINGIWRRFSPSYSFSIVGCINASHFFFLYFCLIARSECIMFIHGLWGDGSAARLGIQFLHLEKLMDSLLFFWTECVSWSYSLKNWHIISGRKHLCLHLWTNNWRWLSSSIRATLVF